MKDQKHPSLREIIDENLMYEWLSLKVTGFGIADQVDSTNFAYDDYDVTEDMSFWLIGAACKSEFETYSFESVRINLISVDYHCLEYLQGERPLGLINYYDPENVQINLSLKPQIYNNLLSLIAGDISLLDIRIAIPVWKEKEAKVLPVLKYQVVYKQEAH